MYKKNIPTTRMKKETIFIYLYGVEKRCGATSRLEFEYEFENDRDGRVEFGLSTELQTSHLVLRIGFCLFAFGLTFEWGMQLQ